MAIFATSAFVRGIGDSYEQFIGLQTVSSSGVLSPSTLADFGFEARTNSGGFLKSISGASISEATAGEVSSLVVPGKDKTKYSWLKFKVAADTSAKISAKPKITKYRIRAISTADPTSVETVIAITGTEK